VNILRDKAVTINKRGETLINSSREADLEETQR
jgi:hypothetical protein